MCKVFRFASPLLPFGSPSQLSPFLDVRRFVTYCSIHPWPLFCVYVIASLFSLSSSHFSYAHCLSFFLFLPFSSSCVYQLQYESPKVAVFFFFVERQSKLCTNFSPHRWTSPEFVYIIDMLRPKVIYSVPFFFTFYSGRIISSEGRRDLDRIACQVAAAASESA